MSERGTRVVIGGAATVMGLVLLAFVPVTTLQCRRETPAGPATCDVRSALLGLVPVDEQQVRGAREATVGSEQGNRRHRGAALLVLRGDSGSVVPAGLREVKPQAMSDLADRLNAFFADGRPGEVAERLYNWKANLVGGIMVLIGLSTLVSAGASRSGGDQ